MTSTESGFNGAEVEAWRQWVRDNQHGLYLCVVTIMEIRYGIEKSRAKGATNKSQRLAKWLVSAETVHRGRIIPVTIDIAHKAGELLYRAVSAGMTPSSEDAIIAAAAEVRGFTILSRNARHMAALKAKWLNPLDSLPSNVPSPIRPHDRES